MPAEASRALPMPIGQLRTSQAPPMPTANEAGAVMTTERESECVLCQTAASQQRAPGRLHQQCLGKLQDINRRINEHIGLAGFECVKRLIAPRNTYRKHACVMGCDKIGMGIAKIRTAAGSRPISLAHSKSPSGAGLRGMVSVSP